jgi:hypothetical protein
VTDRQRIIRDMRNAASSVLDLASQLERTARVSSDHYDWLDNDITGLLEAQQALISLFEED